MHNSKAWRVGHTHNTSRSEAGTSAKDARPGDAWRGAKGYRGRGSIDDGISLKMIAGCHKVALLWPRYTSFALANEFPSQEQRGLVYG